VQCRKQNNIKSNLLIYWAASTRQKKGSQLKLITILRKLKPHLRSIPNQLDTLDTFRNGHATQSPVSVPKASVSAAADVYYPIIFQLLLMRHWRRHRHRHQVQQLQLNTAACIQNPAGNSKSGWDPPSFGFPGMIVGGLFYYSSWCSKFKSIENDIKSLDTDSVDIEPLKGISKNRSRCQTHCRKKRWKHHRHRLYQSIVVKRGWYWTDLESIQLHVLKELLAPEV
jgi:hypothetical protein